nr:hypothetical protein [Kibdelosporangium sp. MJ126-NF4]
MMFLSGQDIYENFTNGRGTADMVGSADIVAGAVNNYNQRGDQIKSLLGKMDGVWKGDAAGAAHRSVGPLAVEHALAAPAMDGMRDLVQRQAGSFNDAKHTVVPVPPAPETVDPLAAFLSPGDLVTFQQQLNTHNTATQHNVDVMRGYENASAYNMDMPRTFGSITSDQSEIRIAQSATPPPSPPSPGDRPSPRKPKQGVPLTGGIGERPRIGTAETAAPTINTPGEGPSHTAPPSQTSPPTGTTPGGYKPLPPPGLGTGTGSGLGTSGTGPGVLDSATGTGGGIPAAGVGSPGRGGVPATTAGTGGPGSKPGGGPVGRPGVGTVSGPGASAEAAVARNTPAGRSIPGGMPMGAVPAGRGRNDEDEERRRASFLEEPDPETVFGLDEPTAPPVIGG